MNSKIENTGTSYFVTLFAETDTGKFHGEVIHSGHIGINNMFTNSVREIVAYLHPSERQLDSMVAALNDGRLDISSLANAGSARNGFTNVIYAA